MTPKCTAGVSRRSSELPRRGKNLYCKALARLEHRMISHMSLTKADSNAVEAMFFHLAVQSISSEDFIVFCR
jgi:hypothetical protein